MCCRQCIWSWCKCIRIMDWQTRYQWENLLDFHRQWEWLGARKTSQNAQVRFKSLFEKNIFLYLFDLNVHIILSFNISNEFLSLHSALDIVRKLPLVIISQLVTMVTDSSQAACVWGKMPLYSAAEWTWWV